MIVDFHKGPYKRREEVRVSSRCNNRRKKVGMTQGRGKKPKSAYKELPRSKKDKETDAP